MYSTHVYSFWSRIAVFVVRYTFDRDTNEQLTVSQVGMVATYPLIEKFSQC